MAIPQTPLRIGIQIQPQATTIADIRRTWRAADELGADSIWTWDHFFPLYGEPDAEHFEGWTLLSVMAADTSRAKLGMLVSGNNYRNPELLADMARTLDHVSGGRMYLGVGAGWFERDYDEYGYEFGTAADRLRRLGDDLPRMKSRLAKVNPAPVGDLPLMIGGGGERVTLRLVAKYGDAWNTFGPPENFARKSGVLDEWCEREGRDPSTIERTVAVNTDDVHDIGRYVDAGASHVIVAIGSPFDLSPLESLMAQRDEINR
jgi:probable F420-dependent oxidoreductase